MDTNTWMTIVLLLKAFLGVNGLTSVHEFTNSPGNITKREGEDVLFNWTYATTITVVNIEWKKDNVRMSVENVLGNEQPTIYPPYVGRLVHGENADVMLKNLIISDTGNYSCSVLDSDGNKTADTSYLIVFSSSHPSAPQIPNKQVSISGGTIAGIVVGLVLVLIVVACGVVTLFSNRRT